MTRVHAEVEKGGGFVSRLYRSPAAVSFSGRLPRTLALAFLLLWSPLTLAQPVRVVRDERHDVSPPLKSRAPLPIVRRALDREPLKEERDRGLEAPAVSAPAAPDPVVQRRPSGKFLLNMPVPSRSFEGISNINGFYVPDTSGAVGPSHYVQWVLTSFQVFSKNGVSLYGPAAGNTLWAGFGGPCETRNDGDPIVLYDSIADRWLFSQYTNAPPYGQCVAVSRTPDPLGAYNRYFFSLSQTIHYDYPKFGVWPDGYYMTGNRVDRAHGNAFAGTAAIVLDRQKMLAGLPATYQEFTLSGFSALPADLDGRRLPPAGSPGYFVHPSPGSLDLYRLHVDWANPANSALTGPTSLPAASYNVLCPATGNCVPQPAPGVALDALGSFPMQRFAYRNFGDHESFVFNLSVDASSAPPVHAGVRWYEVRNTPPGGASSVYQQGTYAPDAAHRWMGSAAMDAAGDIAVGYSISDAVSIFPGIRYTGRLAGDPLGTLPQGEVTAVSGTGAETGSLGRWGDYSTMSVDPTDDCTFWYTSEYLTTTDTAPWQTRILSFKFPGCVACVPPATPSISGPAAVCAGAPVTLTATGGYSTYQWYRGPNPIVGATSQTYAIGSAGSGDAGNYSVTGTVSGCASAQSAPFTLTVNPTPPSAAIAAPSSTCPGSSGNSGSVPSAGAGATYTWGIANGVITGGDGTPAIVFRAGNSGTVTLTVLVTDSNGCSASGRQDVAIVAGPACGAGFYTIPPCRIADTRLPDGPYGGPAISAGSSRTFGLANRCGIPASARAVSANVTVTDATAPGDLRVFPAGTTSQVQSTINYSAGKSRANNGVLTLGAQGDVTVFCEMPSGTVQFVLDVTGYFQ